MANNRKIESSDLFELNPVSSLEATTDEKPYKNNPHLRSSVSYLESSWLSYKRYKLHSALFEKEGTSLNNLLLTKLDQRFKKIILELTPNYPVISNLVYHWTTLSNFHGIFNEGNIFGSQTLTERHLPFSKNALTTLDVENGDGNVICCAPYLVDHMGLSKHKVGKEGFYVGNEIRPNLIRLTIDLNKISIFGKYNQFFKLSDFNAPSYNYDLILTDEFTIHISKNTYKVLISFTFDNQTQKVIIPYDFWAKDNICAINKGESICYGNLSTINRFCLLKFFEFVDKIDDINFKIKIKNYLNSLSDNEIKKILVIFGQSLTIYSEYNFNHSLKLTSNLISEIYFCKKNRFVDLKNLSPKSYDEALRSITCGVISLPQQEPETPPIFMKDAFHISIHGVLIQAGLRELEIKKDFRNIPVNNFTGEYYETRGPIIYNNTNINSNNSNINDQLDNQNSSRTNRF